MTEAGTGVDVVVTRAENRLGAVSVDFTTREISAVATADYTLTRGTITVVDSDTAPKSRKVPITEESANEAEETFSLELSNATGGAKIGAQWAPYKHASPETAPIFTSGNACL